MAIHKNTSEQNQVHQNTAMVTSLKVNTGNKPVLLHQAFSTTYKQSFSTPHFLEWLHLQTMTLHATFPGVATPTNNDSPSHISWSCSTYKQWLSRPHFLEWLHLRTMTLHATFPGVAPPTNNDSPGHISWSCSTYKQWLSTPHFLELLLAPYIHQAQVPTCLLPSLYQTWNLNEQDISPIHCFVFLQLLLWRGITNSSSCINVSYKTSIITQWLETCRFSRSLAHFHHTRNNSSENMCKHAQSVVNLNEFTWFRVMQ